MNDHKGWHYGHYSEVRWDSGFYNNQNKTCWKHRVSLPNVVPGACDLRVTGSRTVAGTDQKVQSPKEILKYMRN